MVGLLLFAAVSGDGVAETPTPMPQRQRTLVVYGDDPCPPSHDNDVVVCARRPEEERYRIPAPLRRGNRRGEMSWTAQNAELEDAQRDSRPNGCSVVGSFGQSGCTQAMIRQWWAERRARRQQLP